MDDLVQWLRAQLDEDERVAQAAASIDPDDLPGDNWMFDSSVARITDEHGRIVLAGGSYGGTWLEDGRGTHIARHDPARVLREVEAKRERLRFIDRLIRHASSREDSVTTITVNTVRDLSADVLLRIEALPYSDRPGYREEWRP